MFIVSVCLTPPNLGLHLEPIRNLKFLPEQLSKRGFLSLFDLLRTPLLLPGKQSKPLKGSVKITVSEGTRESIKTEAMSTVANETLPAHVKG
jgi:hypothetical protein